MLCDINFSIQKNSEKYNAHKNDWYEFWTLGHREKGQSHSWVDVISDWMAPMRVQGIQSLSWANSMEAGIQSQKWP